MADNVTTLPNRGKTLLTGAGRTLSTTGKSPTGAEKWFDDVAVSSSPGVRTKRSNRQVKCILVRNRSGIALEPKKIVKWKSGSYGEEVDGYCTVDHEAVAGVVDEHLPSGGAANNDLFWIAVEGPSVILTGPAESATTGVFDVGDAVSALTAAASTNTTAAGYPRPVAVTTNATNILSISLNRIGRALSAKTSGQTNTDLLVDVDIFT